MNGMGDSSDRVFGSGFLKEDIEANCIKAASKEAKTFCS
jgi:hypothetical protein